MKEKVVGERLVAGEVTFIPVAEPQVGKAVGIDVVHGDRGGRRGRSGIDGAREGEGAVTTTEEQGTARRLVGGQFKRGLQVIEIAREDGVGQTVVVEVGEGQNITGIECHRSERC